MTTTTLRCLRKKLTTRTEIKPQPTREACSRCGKMQLGMCYLETGACFKCGKTSHCIRDYPKQKSEVGTKAGDGKLRPKILGRVFALTEQDVETTHTVVTGIIQFLDHDARVLIDLGSTHSFIASSFAVYFKFSLELLDYELSVSTLLGKSMTTKFMFKSCVLMISKSEMLVGLILLELRDFDIILSMDWLAAHHACVDCYNKEVTFNFPDQPKITFKGTRKFPRLISAIQAER